MSNREVFTTEVYVNNEQAQDASAKLSAKLEKQRSEWTRLRDELGEFDKKTLKARHAMEDTQKSLDTVRQGTENYRKALDDLGGRSMDQLVRMQRQLKRELDKTKPNTDEWKRLSSEYQQVTERAAKLKKEQQGIVAEGDKTGKGLKGLIARFGGLGQTLTAMPVVVKGVTAALKAITVVAKETVNASQTMGDKWRNTMSAMKTTTDAFFMSLSTGDWTAFNDGITEALKKARELAELKDLLGSFQIAGGYMQAKYRTDYTSQMTEATNTENDAATRKAALDAAKADLDAQREFTEREAEATFKALKTMFDSWKGITFDSQEEFDKFFDRLFRYTTTGADEAVNEIQRLKKSMDDAKKLMDMAAWGGVVPDEVLATFTAAQNAYNEAVNNASKETLALVQAADLNDERHKELIQTYAAYRADIQRIDQDEKTYNRTRDRVLKQIGQQGETINKVMASIDEWVSKERQSATARYNANKASFDSIADAYREYQDELASIEAEGEAKREEARKKFEEEQRKAAEEARNKAKAAADKAYQSAQDRLAKSEAAQLNTLKRMYASGLMDKATYEAQKAALEEDFLKQRLATAQKYGRDTDQYMSQLLDRQIARMETAKAMLKEEADEMERYYADLQRQDEERFGGTGPKKGEIEGLDVEGFNDKIWQKAANIRTAIADDSARKEYENEVKWAQKLAEKRMITAEEAEKYILQAKLKYAAKAAEQVNSIMEQSSDFVSALKDAEAAKLEAQYQADLTAAGDNAKRKAEIEAQYEEDKLELSKKYADTEMVINIAKTIAAGALAAIKAWELGPIAGPIAAALVAATTAAEVATIVAQRNAIKNSSVSSSSSSSSSTSTGTRTMTGYAEGGYTENHATWTTVGEKGTEWVAPAWMVRSAPVTFANLERYRKAGSHGRSGSVRHGFADGGFTDGAGAATVGSGVSKKEILAAIREGACAGVKEGLAGELVRAYVVRRDISELDEQDARFHKQTSR